MGTSEADKNRKVRGQDAGQLLRAIARDQRAPVEAGEDNPDRPLLDAPGLLERVGSFVARTLVNKDTYKSLLAARDELAEAARPLFERACEEAGELLTAADLAGGSMKLEEGQELEIFAGDVQWQCLLETRDVEIGSEAEKALNAAARRLMPEGFRLQLVSYLLTPAEREALVADLGEERIRKWFKVTAVRRAPEAEVVRTLWGKGAAGRKTLGALRGAKAVVVKQFPKLVARVP